MIVFGSLGLLRRYPPIKSRFSGKISVAVAIHWESTTVSFSPLLESVVSAKSVILVGITIESTVSGKINSIPRVFFIILSMGWCVFVSILGVSLPIIEWRYIYRIFIFLLVMDESWYRIMFKKTLGISLDMKNLDSEDYTFHMDLMEVIHGCWPYISSMKFMEEENIYIEDYICEKIILIIYCVLPSAILDIVCVISYINLTITTFISNGISKFKRCKEIKDDDIFTESFFKIVTLLLAFDLKEQGNIAETLEEIIPKFMRGSSIIHVTYMEKLEPISQTFGTKETRMIILENLAGKKLSDFVEEEYRVDIYHKDFGTEVLVPFCLYFRVTYIHIGFKAAVSKKKVQPSDAAFKSCQGKANMKLDNHGSDDRLASKSILQKASSNSLLMYFSRYMAHTFAYVIICVTVILYNISVITLSN